MKCKFSLAYAISILLHAIVLYQIMPDLQDGPNSEHSPAQAIKVILAFEPLRPSVAPNESVQAKVMKPPMSLPAQETQINRLPMKRLDDDDGQLSTGLHAMTRAPEKVSSDIVRKPNWFKVMPAVDEPMADSDRFPEALNRYGMHRGLAKRANQPVTRILNTSIAIEQDLQYGANGETFLQVDGTCFEIKEEGKGQVFWFSDRCETKPFLNVKAMVESVEPTIN